MAIIKTYGNKYPVVAYVTQETYEKLEEARGKVPRAHYVENLIDANLNPKQETEAK